jgi:hypothetical protein
MASDNEPKRHRRPAFTEMSRDAQNELFSTMIYLALYIAGPVLVLLAIAHTGFNLVSLNFVVYSFITVIGAIILAKCLQPVAVILINKSNKQR